VLDESTARRGGLSLSLRTISRARSLSLACPVPQENGGPQLPTVYSTPPVKARPYHPHDQQPPVYTAIGGVNISDDKLIPHTGFVLKRRARSRRPRSRRFQDVRYSARQQLSSLNSGDGRSTRLRPGMEVHNQKKMAWEYGLGDS